MAVVVDVMREARVAFAAFARRYLEIPDEFYRDGVMPAKAVDVAAKYLIECGALSKVELDLALERLGISGVAVY